MALYYSSTSPHTAYTGSEYARMYGSYRRSSKSSAYSITVYPGSSIAMASPAPNPTPAKSSSALPPSPCFPLPMPVYLVV